MMTRRMMIALLCLAIVSLALKIAIERPTNYDINDKAIIDGVYARLEANSFHAFKSPDLKVVGGLRGECSLWVATARPEGGQDYFFNLQYGADMTVRFLFRGQISVDRPVLRPLVSRIVEKLVQLKGERVALLPLFQIAYTKGCDEAELIRIID